MSTLVIDAHTFLQPARLAPVAYKPAHGGYPGSVRMFSLNADASMFRVLAVQPGYRPYPRIRP